MAGGCNGIGMESLQVNEGYSRLSMPPVNVDPPVTPDLILIQDEIRTHFGWGLDADSRSAIGLLAACDESHTAPSIWSHQARLDTRLHLQEKLITRPITVPVSYTHLTLPTILLV